MHRMIKYPLMILLAVALFACQDDSGEKSPQNDSQKVKSEKVDPSESKKTIDSSETEKEEAAVEEEYDPWANLPEPKSDEELRLLKLRQIEAQDAEKAYFGSASLEEWISDLGETEDEDGMLDFLKLSDEHFASLTIKESIYYYLFYPESWDQICAEILVYAGEVKAISSNLPYDLSGAYQTDRQRESLRKNSDSVDFYLVDCIRTNRMASTEMLRLVVERNLSEAIPVLVEGYREQIPRNDLYLTTMIQLMSIDKFKPWENSDIYQDFELHSWSRIALNEVNADKIIYYAQQFVPGGE